MADSEREDFVLGVGFDLAGLGQGLDAIEAAIGQIGQLVDGTSLGSLPQFQGRGRELARALLDGFQQELAGRPIDLGTHVLDQLNLDPGKIEAQANRYIGALERVRRAAIESGLPVQSSPAIATGSQLLGLKAVEDQSSRTNRAVTDVNASVNVLRRQLTALNGLTIPTAPLVTRDAQGVASLTPAAQKAITTAQRGGASVPSITSLTPDSLEQARQQRRVEVQGRLQNLRAERLALESGQTAIPLPAPAPRPAAPAPAALPAAPTPTPVPVATSSSSRAGGDIDALAKRLFAGSGGDLDRVPQALQKLGFSAKEAAAATERLAAAEGRAAGAVGGGAAGGGKGGGGKGGGRAGSGDPDDPEEAKRRLLAQLQASGFGGGMQELDQLLQGKAARGRSRSIGGEAAAQSVDGDPVNFERDFRDRERKLQQARARANAENEFFPTEDIPARERTRAKRQQRAEQERAAKEQARQEVFGDEDVLDRERQRARSQKKAQANRDAKAQAQQEVFGEDDPLVRERARAQSQFDRERVNRARQAAKDEFLPNRGDEDVLRAQARRAAETQARATRTDNLRGFLDDPNNSFSEKTRAAFRGAAPGDPGIAPGTLPPATLKNSIKQGFLGSSENLGLQLGQTLKFSLFYGAAYAALQQLTRGFGIAGQEALKFEDGLASLNIVTDKGRSANAAFADSLGEIASSKGLSPGAGLAAGTQALGLFDLTGKPRQTQVADSKLVTEVAARIATVSGTDLSETLTQLASVNRAFDQPVASVARTEDTVSFIGRQSGRPPAEILTALAQIGEIASKAGFDQETTAAIIARLTSSTGQSPQAVAGFLSQVLSKADDPNATAKLRSVGVKTEGTTLAQQFTELAGKNLPQSQLNQIVQAFGRSRSGQALQIILEQQQEIQKLAKGAREADGAGEDAFNKVMGTIGKQLRKLGGDVSELLKDLASTGVVDSLALIVRVLDLVVRAADQLVDIFNGIPRPIRSVAFALGELYLAARVFGGGAVLTKIAQVLRGGAAATAVGEATSVASAAAGAAAARAGAGRAVTALPTILNGATTASGAVVAGQVLSRGAVASEAAAGAGFLAAAGARLAAVRAGVGALLTRVPVSTLAARIAIPLAPIIAVGKAAEETRDATRLRDRANAASATSINADELRNAAAEQRRAKDAALAQQRFKVSDIFSLGIPLALNNIPGSGADRREAGARKAAAELEARARALDAANKSALQFSPETAFGSFASTEAVSAGLQSLGQRGYSAAERLEILGRAFDSLSDKSTTASGAVGSVFKGQGQAFATSVGGAAGTAQVDLIEQLRKQAAQSSGIYTGANSNKSAVSRLFGNIANGLTFKGTRAGELENLADKVAEVDPNKLSTAVGNSALDTLKRRGKDPAKSNVFLTEADVKAIDEAARTTLANTLGPAFTDLTADAKKRTLEAFTKNLRNQLGDFTGSVTAEGVAAFLTAAQADAATAGQDATLRTGDGITGARTNLGELRVAAEKARAGIPKIADQDGRDQATRLLAQNETLILAAEKALADSQVQRIAVLTALSVSTLRPDDKAGRGTKALTGLKFQLGALPANDIEGRAAKQTEINNQIEQNAADARAARNSNDLAAVDPRRALDRLRTQRNNAVRDRRTLSPGGQAYAEAGDAIKQLNLQIQEYGLAGQTLADKAASDPTNGVQQAQIALDDASRRLDAARSGGDLNAIGDALTNYNASRRSYLTSVVDQANSINLAGPRAGDDVALGNATLQNLQRSRADATDPGAQGALDRQIKDQVQANAQAVQAQRAADRNSQVLPGDTVTFARNGVDSAREAIDTFSKNTRGYFDAITAYRAAQQGLSDALLAYSANVRLLSVDQTDPLAVARAAVQAAKDKLRAADTPEEKVQGQLDVRGAQNQAEATAFGQRLSDAQTAEQLGRISHQAYIRYLQSEHDRLSAIKSRTRQQTDELNQIDLAIKGASEQLQGQFNLGQIKVPTVFEARRASLGGGLVSQTTSSQTVNVEINGADIAQVKSFIGGLLGPSTNTRVATAPRRR